MHRSVWVLKGTDTYQRRQEWNKRRKIREFPITLFIWNSEFHIFYSLLYSQPSNLWTRQTENKAIRPTKRIRCIFWHHCNQNQLKHSIWSTEQKKLHKTCKHRWISQAFFFERSIPSFMMVHMGSHLVSAQNNEYNNSTQLHNGKVTLSSCLLENTTKRTWLCKIPLKDPNITVFSNLLFCLILDWLSLSWTKMPQTISTQNQPFQHDLTSISTDMLPAISIDMLPAFST